MLFVLDRVPGNRVPAFPAAFRKHADEGPIVVLKRDDWNDYSYRTSCDAFIFLSATDRPISLGGVRIMYKGQIEGPWVFEHWKDQSFTMLPDNHVALGRSMEFYENLHGVDDELALEILHSMRDAAIDHARWDRFKGDPCFVISLLRETSLGIEMRDRVPQLFGLHTELIDVFDYSVRLPGAPADHRITFDFSSHYEIPHRVMLLVGPNGTGKTQLLANLAIALTGVTQRNAAEGEEDRRRTAVLKRRGSGIVEPLPSIYQVIAISFNAFDKFEIPEPHPEAQIRYTYSGIRHPDGRILTEDGLVVAIKDALSRMDVERRVVFAAALERVLGPETADELIDREGKVQTSTDRFYIQRSAGQRIVLNTLTHLIANLRSRSLVLLDEPETHLHPSLITTLISEILGLLAVFSSYAVIATHSPLIAQQVPSERIRILRRAEGEVHVNTPTIECFGENLSEISNVLFETREFERDYTSVLDELLKQNSNNPELVEALFSRGLGANARIYLRSAALSD